MALTTDFDGEGENDMITVGTILYHHFLLIKAPKVNLAGPISLVNATESRMAQSRIAIEGDHVAVYPSGFLEAGFVLL